MKLSYILVVAAFMSWPQLSPLAQERDISGSMQVSAATVLSSVLARLEADGVDQRLAPEIQLATEHAVPPSFSELRFIPPDLRKAVLEVRSECMMPMVENSDQASGLPDVSGVRVSSRSKLTGVGAVTASSPLEGQIKIISVLFFIFCVPTIVACKIWGDEAINPVSFALLWVCISFAILGLSRPGGSIEAGAGKFVLMMATPIAVVLIFVGRAIAKSFVKGK